MTRTSPAHAGSTGAGGSRVDRPVAGLPSRLTGQGLPAVLVEALAILQAPPLVTMEEVTRWASTGLEFTITCGAGAGGVASSARVMHRVRVDPFTGAVVLPESVQGPRRARVEAAHAQWSMTAGTVPACFEAGAVLARWVGAATTVESAPWTRVRDGEMAAVRTVMRAVQFAAIGLAPVLYPGWIGLGVSPETMRATAEVVRARGWDFAQVQAALLVQAQWWLTETTPRPGVAWSDAVLRARLLSEVGPPF